MKRTTEIEEDKGGKFATGPQTPATYEIACPVQGFSGERNGVKFGNGVGRTDDSSKADWFRLNGYKVKEIPASR